MGLFFKMFKSDGQGAMGHIQRPHRMEGSYTEEIVCIYVPVQAHVCVYVCMHVSVKGPKERSEIHREEEVIGRVRILSIDGCVKGKGHLLPEGSGEATVETFAGSGNSRKRCPDSFDLSSCGGSVLSVSAEGGAWGGKETREGSGSCGGVCQEEGQDC